ncbi:protein NO VEIN domain-containing protein [Xanthobacter pseudotagetidis]|uniref:protein NO VEIN domain-containing protein n=1 Tax=Xanthobacter pseudotagetidis TaxID=3119911 RepID=UPI003728480D
MATIADEPESRASEIAVPPPTRSGRRSKPAQPPATEVDEPDYVPPDFSGSRRTRIGSSFIEQFVAGHDASDVLRELVQNEYDGGGEKLMLTFGSRSLEVIGSGRNIDRNGWERLSVIVGTGNVMGSAQAEVVAPKENGIGSKNFGLRSLFRFGDEIHVRSAGQVALLDLQTQETGRERDPAWCGEKGVRVHVPYRQQSSERLEAFTLDREEHALGLMAVRIPDTLVKLAHSGKRRGLREVDIRSIRTGRTLRWKQEAKPHRCRVAGVAMVARIGRLTDGDAKGVPFQEEEYYRSVALPAEHAARRFPSYYKLPGGRVRIAVSVPIARRKVDIGQHGHFYYPLKAPSSRTGCAISVSAPFELDTERSKITDLVWNDWLIDQAVELVIALLKGDWFARYGADAFKALMGDGTAEPDRFVTKLAERLKEDACWPTIAKGDSHFAKAGDIVLPTDEAYAGFLSDNRYLDPVLAADQALCDLIADRGAKRFTLASLVRLRCAPSEEAKLETKVGDGANFFFTNYDGTLRGLDLQKRLAAALSLHPRRLSKQNRADLGKTASTLSATWELKPATQLMIVDPDLWADCPEPEANRLHPELVPFKAISGHCRTFDEEQWLIDAAERAATAPTDDRERETLYRKLLAREAPISRPALTALRNNPVVKNQRDEWVAPAAMVSLKRPLARFLDPAIDAPSKELLQSPSLLSRLRIRNTLSGTDLVRYAGMLADRPETAERFEKLLTDNLKLLGPATVEELREIPCLRARSGKLAAPSALHLDTPTNRLCIGDDGRIAGGSSDLLFRKLKLKPAPDSDTLLEILGAHRDAETPPGRPDLLYPALVDARARERRAKSEIVDLEICWVAGGYHAPSDILVGTRVAGPLAEAIPVHRHSDEVGRAYQDLGAPVHATDAHWARFFCHASSDWAPGAPLDTRRRRLLLEAYATRGALGLPQGLDEVRCLIDDRARLFTLADLRAGRLVEPDFAPLEEALRAADSSIGIVERSERSRPFFSGLGIRPLSEIAGAGLPELGPPGRPHLWYKPKHRERILAMLHRPLFARALYEVAYRNRHGHAGFVPATYSEIEAQLSALADISFFQSIGRRYNVGGASVLVPAQIALAGDRINLVAPKTKNGFQLLLAEALAEIAGAVSVATMRGLANAFLPLVLCGTQEELIDYLDRMGIPRDRWGGAEEEEGQSNLDLDDDEDDADAEEDALRQVFDNLDTGSGRDDTPVEPVQPGPPPPPAPRPPPPPPFVLPDMEQVALSVAASKGAEIQPREPSGRGGGGGGGWLPPTPAEVERAGLLGRRGEELIYRMELQKVREMGFEEPERYVIWTSRDEPGADHDIRSIDAEGRPRWIEVKATTGTDGRFDWPRKEFEKALRERDRYELWRIYRVADRAPVAKCFRNPARMLGTRQIALELGMLRANIEDLS